MSKSTKHIWNCIHCGHPQEITIWQSVNVSLSPGLKGKLLNGDLMRVRCVRCGTETELAYALLYHDQDRRFMVWYVVPTRDGIITICAS